MEQLKERSLEFAFAEKRLERVKSLGVLFGILFILGGILGFVPSVTKNEMFLGTFMVNRPHNAFHIATGVVFLMASGAGAARLWFQISGAIYALFAILGFMNLNGALFGIISTVPANSWGHAGLAIAMLIIGLTTPKPHPCAKEQQHESGV